ncbi:unnamed protein product [Rotaria sp. Silwood1]|nr:unnamed protein product [Rotaria sp. Silwood1]CAF5020632.1 unnamed protein product [Rotaria sp. Silwood1]
MQELECEADDKDGDEVDEDDDDPINDDNGDDEINDDDNGDDTSYVNQPSTNCLKRPSHGFSTPALKRSYNNGKLASRSNQRCNRDHSLQNDDRSRLTVTVARDPAANKNMNHHYREQITGNASRLRCVTHDDNCRSDTNIGPTFKDEMISGMRSLRKQLSKLTKTVDHLTIPSVSKNDQLLSYRDENDKENYPDEIIWNGKNLLKVTAQDVGDYGRKLMDILFTEEELQSNAIHIKYRLSEDGYRRYYTNTLRVKLSRYLYDQGTRKLKKNVGLLEQQQQHHLP